MITNIRDPLSLDVDRDPLIRLCIQKMTPEDFDDALCAYTIANNLVDHEVKTIKGFLDGIMFNESGPCSGVTELYEHYRAAAEDYFRDWTNDALLSYLREDEYEI